MSMLETSTAEDLRYPIGRFTVVASTPELRLQWISEIADAESALRAAVAGLSDTQLDTAYREGGWTIRQVVHHVADSHMNGFIRFCKAVTEDNPTITAYQQDAWVQLPHTLAPVDSSLTLLALLIQRWIPALRQLSDSAWTRGFLHPETGPQNVDSLVQLYAWHGRHHCAHITNARRRLDW
jgi:uncharacterized damage-inducible protein DinB